MQPAGPQKNSAGESALERASIWARISFSWVGPLIKKGWLDLKFEQEGARFLMPACDDAPQLSEQFEQSYAKVKVRTAYLLDSAASGVLGQRSGHAKRCTVWAGTCQYICIGWWSPPLPPVEMVVNFCSSWIHSRQVHTN
jgi:hypothetical protein